VKLDRGQVWKRLGAPTDQQGSVNEPRTQREFGVAWNEKWIYLGEDGRTIERVVLWNRYDLVGVYRVRSDGSAEVETLGDE
jgi:hypothetical protein